MAVDTETLDTINRKLGMPWSTVQILSGSDVEIVVAEAAKYNGWANRETWAAYLHLGNDESLYNIARDVASGDTHGEALQEWFDALADDVFDSESAAFGSAQTSPEVRMMVREVGSSWRVDWRAVRDALVGED